MFIAIDGIDGSGKTTLARQLAELFTGKKTEVFLTKEPTDYSKWGQRLRRASIEGRLPANVELEYFRQDRQNHIEHHIKPALAAGAIVISDRYVDSTLAFQSNTSDEAETLYQSMVDEILIPDLTFIIDCPVDIGLRRINIRDNGNLSQFEKRETLERAEAIYEARKGENYVHLDGSKNIEDTFIQAIETLRHKFDDNPRFRGLLSGVVNIKDMPLITPRFAAG
tara:strand:+ start:6256 stop:6927 length:672 start_codon:yes stop_codon:yes gene_type:complete